MHLRNSSWLLSRDEAKLMDVALGRKKADLVVLNAKLLNVYTGELLENHGISVCDEFIAYVGESAEDTVGPETTVIDADKKVVIPGLIDGHTHLGWLCTIHEYLRYIIPGGTTSIVTETLELYPVGGAEAILEFVASLEDQPIKFLALAPVMASISRTAMNMPVEDLKCILNLDRVIGLGESYWQNIIQDPGILLPRLKESLNLGKVLEGHTAGASEKKLNAYTATGITSCHEPIKADEVLARLRLGIHVMAREGSVRRDLKEISKIKDFGVDLRRLILVTDGAHPDALIENGYMEFVVQRAIDYGFDPVSAIQMATLNVAEHFAVDHLIGGIAPGRLADFVIMPDLGTIRAEKVISNGQIIAEDGEIKVKPRRHDFPKHSRHSIHLTDRCSAADFAIKHQGGAPEATVRVMELITDLVTKEHHLTVPIVDGQIEADVNKDLLKIAAIDRTHAPGKKFVGLIKGFNLTSGAIATSASWDSSDITVVGTNGKDMAAAVNRIQALQGGTVLCDGEEVITEISMPIYGVMSDLSMEELDQKLVLLKEALADRGSRLPDPLLTLVTLTGAAIPFFRICEEGLVTLKDGKNVSLIVE